MMKFEYKNSEVTTVMEIENHHLSIPAALEYFEDFLRSAGYRFDGELVLKEEEEPCRTIDEIAEENERLQQEVQRLSVREDVELVT